MINSHFEEAEKEGAKPIHDSTIAWQKRSGQSNNEPNTLCGQRFPRENSKIIFPKTLPDHSIQTFSLITFRKNLQKLNHFINVVKTALNHFKRKSLPEYRNQFGLKEDGC